MANGTLEAGVRSIEFALVAAHHPRADGICLLLDRAHGGDSLRM